MVIPQVETLKNYGIENKTQLIFLKERDFTYYPGTYTISTQSVFSMGGMLNLKLGNEHKAVAGESTVVKTLQKSGYKTYGIFKNRYFFKSIEKPEEFYDEIFPKTKSTGVLKAILEGEFRWDIDHEAELSEKYLSFKRKVLSEKSKKKRFIYTHTGPYHSIHNGKCDSKKEIKKFEERLKRSNEEMKQDVNQILKSDPNSIIVIHGDHGPFLLNKCGIIKDKTQINKVNRNFLQDNFSTFLAIKWPKGYTNKYKDTNIRTTQDTFFEVFEYLLDNEISNDFRLSPITDKKNTDGFIGAGVQINDGVIIGGPDDKKKLFKLD